MTRIEVSCVNAKAVVWPYLGPDRDGQTTISPPVEIDVRWEDVKSSYITADGDTHSADADIVVDSDVPLRSIMAKGKLVDLLPTTQLFDVVFADDIPDIKSRDRFRSLKAIRRSTPLPTVIAPSSSSSSSSGV